MSLNIKDKEIHAMVRELAALKGTTLTAAVKLAVGEEIEREKNSQSRNAAPTKRKRSEILQDFTREFVRRAKSSADFHSWDIDGLLYDENGLPK